MTSVVTTPLVLDASAMVELVLRSPEGRWLRSRLDWGQGVHAPELVQTEAASVLRRYELRGALPAERVTVAFRRMLDLPVFLVSTAALLPEAWALRHAVTVNDACYVVLARHLGATLVTGDLRLARTPQLDVPTLVPPRR